MTSRLEMKTFLIILAETTVLNYSVMICLNWSSRHSEMSNHVKLVASKKDVVVFFNLNENRKTYANV